MYIHLALAGVGTIAMVALGIYFMMESSAIGDRIQDLDDKEMGSMLQALNAGGTWYCLAFVYQNSMGKDAPSVCLLIAYVV